LDLNPEKIPPPLRNSRGVCLPRFSSIRHTSAGSVRSSSCAGEEKRKSSDLGTYFECWWARIGVRKKLNRESRERTRKEDEDFEQKKGR
jgi:hypothetical protein